MSTTYSPEQIAAVVADATDPERSSYVSDYTGRGADNRRALVEIVEQLRAENADAVRRHHEAGTMLDEATVALNNSFQARLNAESERDSARAQNERLRASLKSIGDQAEECGDPANPAFFDLVSLIADEVHKHKEPVQ